jgi:uncharacterized DUF497 family protein
MPDVYYSFHGVLFEWNKQKALTNLRKHGIPFEAACEAFFDPFVVVLDDDEFVNGEVREKAVGMLTDWRLIFVVYVMREERVRIISARPGTMIERWRYENG